jgi:competence protein ComEA
MSDYLNKYWIIAITVLIACLISGGIILSIELNSHQPVEISLNTTRSPDYRSEVYIDGAVTSPGYYPTKEADSIYELIRSAGLMATAKLDQIRIYIPKIDETSLQQKPQKVSLNRAESWLLSALPGIGQTKAQAIVDYRNRYGYFHRIEDLLKVNGISRPMLDNIKNLVTLED